GLLNPARGWAFFTFLSHKLLRWCCPFFLLGLLITSVLLSEVPFYRALFVAQLAFYALSVLAAYLPGRSRPLKMLRLTTMFTTMNGALLIGSGPWLGRTQRVTWKRTVRLADAGQGDGLAYLDGDEVLVARQVAPAVLAEDAAPAGPTV